MALQRKMSRGAIAAAMGAATALGLKADDAIVLHDSNKLTVRLLPCDVVARVADERARRLAEALLSDGRAATCKIAGSLG
jgi:uncharacterized protein (DUF2384 family)